MEDGTEIVDEISVADAYPTGARPIARDQYVEKFRSLAVPVLGEEESERFLALALRLPELKPKELQELTFTALPGVLPPAGPPSIYDGGLTMLYATTTPAKKRASLRERLAEGGLLQFPGAFNPLSAKLIARSGFDGVYVSGAVLSADLGLPDIGLTTSTEVAARSRQIARVTELPVLADADTGFGEPMNVARTVAGSRRLRAGGAAHRGSGQPQALRSSRRETGRRRSHCGTTYPRGCRRPA